MPNARTIDAYTHAAPTDEQQPDITPPDPDNDPTRWRERPCFYCSVVDGPNFGLLAGPFSHHQQALDLVDLVRQQAEVCDPKSHFYAFGTVKWKNGEPIGRLNSRMGIQIPTRGDQMTNTPVRVAMSQNRWAMSASELKNPHDCSSNDMLLAHSSLLPEEGVYVFRHGMASNQYGDGRSGVTKKHARAAEQVESYTHEIDGGEAEETVRWVEVWVDRNGDFVSFVETPLAGERE